MISPVRVAVRSASDSGVLGADSKTDSSGTRVMVTCAIPSAFLSRVPAKITSSMRAPRRLFADCSPSTQLIASLKFDLPQPFGPTTAAIPLPLNFISVRS